MLYLASQSPRRRDLLSQLGLSFGLLDVDVPEQRLPGEPPETYVSRVAREKAGAGLLAVVANPSAVVLGADTEVVLDDEVFGKPADAEDAARMLAKLSGRTHRVISSVWLVSAGRELQAASISDVSFEVLTPERIAAYIATGDCFGKAGAYAIQGRAGLWVSHISGSYSGIMGLPAHETAQVLHAAGVRLV
jgi:septum formation protein